MSVQLAQVESAAPVRLNLGAGDTYIEGYTAIDRKLGRDVYPLYVHDESVDEIRASHVLEHFSHREVPAVLEDWARALKPGGLLRVAVPDFQVLAEQYLAGAALPLEAYVMGGHVDDDDRHGALFDAESLGDLLSGAGLLGVCRWESEIEDCAALPISLNLQGWKHPQRWPRVSAVMSVPRLGFADNATCAHRALGPLRIPIRQTQGAYWGQCLTRGIERALAEDRPEYILTIDYDSLYTRRHVESLISAAMRHPGADCVAAMQIHRREARALMTVCDESGAPVTVIEREALGAELTRVSSAHFGLTLIRADALESCARPWFHASPDPAGAWGEGRVDDDVSFWRQFEASGLKAYVANRVAIGHAELMIRWPDHNLGVIYQHPSEFDKRGTPEGVWR
jgi:hypothetical protein